MRPNIIGIDPGLSGGIACIGNSGDVTLVDIPTFYNKKKNWIDYKKLATLIRTLSNWGNNQVWIEDVHSMPKQGVASSFKFGRGFGILIGICAAFQFPIRFVSPQKWKRKFKLIKTTKEDSILMANSLYGKKIPLVNDGQAEALLIAHYGKLIYEEEKQC